MNEKMRKYRLAVVVQREREREFKIYYKLRITTERTTFPAPVNHSTYQRASIADLLDW